MAVSGLCFAGLCSTTFLRHCAPTPLLCRGSFTKRMRCSVGVRIPVGARVYPTMVAVEEASGALDETLVPTEAPKKPILYTECGKCRAAYILEPEELGEGRRVACCVCGNQWFQKPERLLELREDRELKEYPMEEKEELIRKQTEAKGARRARKDFRSQASRERGRDSGQRAGHTEHSVFIGNLSYEVTQDDLEKLVAEDATVKRVSLALDQAGRSKGFGFVDLSSAEDVERVMERLSGFEHMGRPLTVRLGRRTPRAGEGEHSLFVGNLSYEATAEDLEKLIAEVATVERVNLIQDFSGRSKGFGFVDLTSAEDVERVMERLNGREHMGRTLTIRRGRAGSRAGEAEHSIFIANVPFDVTEEDLEKVIATEIKPERVTLAVDSEGRSKGFAFADLSSAEDVQRAVEQLDGYDLMGRALTIRAGKKKMQ